MIWIYAFLIYLAGVVAAYPVTKKYFTFDGWTIGERRRVILKCLLSWLAFITSVSCLLTNIHFPDDNKPAKW